MAAADVQQLLRETRDQKLDLPSALHQILVLLFSERMQPLDFEHISRTACDTLLDAHPDVRRRLEAAICEQNCDELWESDILRFDGVSLQSQKPKVLGDYGIERCIRNATDRYRLPLKFRIEEHWQLPQWELEDVDEHPVDPACIEFLHSLKLPVSGERPSLLLHEMGTYKSTTLTARLQNIFQPGQHSFLMSSTGTGKTRLLFEGLTRHWGLYIHTRASSILSRTIMADDEIQSVLLCAARDKHDYAHVLSQLLEALFRRRMQPLDPDYVTPQGCIQLLADHPDIELLVGEAVETQNSSIVASSGLLRFDNTALRSYRPQISSDNTVDRVIEEFKRDHRTIIESFAKSDVRLPSWTPTTACSGDYADFIASLNIPRLDDSKPCLVMHDLWPQFDMPTTAQRLRNLFQPGHHTIFLNGAGAGKTRLLLEGLSRNWGLYLPSFLQPLSPGSSDLYEAISAGLHRMQSTKKFTGLATADVVARNIHLARRVFLQVLLARLTMFHLFLNCAHSPNDTDTRIRWLALQLAPIPLVKRDIFRTLSVRVTVHDASLPYLEGRITDTLLAIRTKLGVDQPIFCVVDDVQHPCLQYPDHFGSSSAVQEMAWAWDRHADLTLILAGRPSGMPLDKLDALGYRLCTDTGSFNEPDEHLNYVRRYLPPRLTSSACGEMLLRRICLWLRGRYRITALFVHCLMAAGYRHPHTLLNTYLCVFGKVNPADGPRHTSAAARKECSIVVGSRGRYDPAQILSQDLQAWSSAQTALNRLMTLGQDAVHFAEDCVHLVSLEFATFTRPDASEVVVNEPLFVFPVADVLFHRWGPTYGFLSSSAASGLRCPPVHKSFHIAAVPLLLLALQGRMRLCDIFAFPDPAPQWVDQVCKLVRLTRSNNGRELQAIPYVTSFPGADADGPWAMESPQWLGGFASEPFCIAAGFSHADLLFALQVGESRTFYVALTILLKNQHVDVPITVIQHVLDSLDSAHLFNVRDAINRPQYPTLDLCTPVDGSGPPSMLRVFATFPDATDIRILRPDKSSQPMASLRMDVLQKLSESIPYDSIVSRLDAAFIRRRKDKLYGDAPISFQAEGDDGEIVG